MKHSCALGGKRQRQEVGGDNMTNEEQFYKIKQETSMKADFSTANISKTPHLKPKQPRWIKSTKGRKKNTHFEF